MINTLSLQPPRLRPMTKTTVPQQTAVTFSGRTPSENLRLFHVTGSAATTRLPDVMHMVTHIKASGTDPKAMAQELTEKAKPFMEGLKALNLPLEITTRITDQVIRDDEGNEKGFESRFTVSMTEKAKKPDMFPQHAAAIHQLSAQQQFRFDGPYYELSPKRCEQAGKSMLNQAYKNALKQAQQLAKVGGFRIETVPNSVSIEPNYHARGGIKAMRLQVQVTDNGAESSSPQLFEYQPITVSSPTVTVQFRMKPHKLNVQA